MNYEEFLVNKDGQEQEAASVAAPEEVEVENLVNDSIDVQKAVVESLAADKAVQDEKIASLQGRIDALNNDISALRDRLAVLQAENTALKEKAKEPSDRAQLQKENEALKSANAALQTLNESLQTLNDTKVSNAISLLDRDVELPDRFPGETREHVLEVIREACDQAVAAGRLRRAQLLEGVLVSNEPSGELQKKRKALEKFFNENQNILSGTVIAELERCGISYKKGENDYLLPSEILLRTY